MKFVTFQTPTAGERSGWINGSLVMDMAAISGGKLPNNLLDFLEDSHKHLDLARQLDESLTVESLIGAKGIYALSDVQLLAPLPRPKSFRDFFAFEKHVLDARRRAGLDMVPQWYDLPAFYFSNHQSIVGPDATIIKPRHANWLDYELELAAVVGRKVQNVSAREAEGSIFGYVILNDWSARDLQLAESPIGLGPAKGKDFATSLGPYIATPDELDAYRDGDRYHLEMTATVNGRLLSHGNAHDMHYTFGEMLERAADEVTVYPGDLIGSGTVGTGCLLELGPEVHRWLEPGDVVELEITGLGKLRNSIVASSAM